MAYALRTRDEVTRDIEAYRREARACYGSWDYGDVHAIINDLLDEWERLG